MSDTSKQGQREPAEELLELVHREIAGSGFVNKSWLRKRLDEWEVKRLQNRQSPDPPKATKSDGGKSANPYLPKSAQPSAPAIVSKGCNRHHDCAVATQEFKAKYGREPNAGFHCHDDECEDCFGC